MIIMNTYVDDKISNMQSTPKKKFIDFVKIIHIDAIMKH